MNALLASIGQTIAACLQKEPSGHKPCTPSDPERPARLNRDWRRESCLDQSNPKQPQLRRKSWLANLERPRRPTKSSTA
jgi:hypothetical protein